MRAYSVTKSIALLTMVLVVLFGTLVNAAERVKPRVIATTDGEIDDQSSMVRFLMYASDYDIVGIVQVNGVQKDGHSKDKWVEAEIEKYGQVLPNLKKHNPDYPTKEYLLSVTTVGNENSADLQKAPDKLSDSKGAQLIMQVLMDEDPRPVHILAWGGANTQANALWQIKTKYPDKWEAAVAKARLYCIWYQDGGGAWIEKNLSEVKMYGAGVTGSKSDNKSWRYVWDYFNIYGYFKPERNITPGISKETQVYMDKPWLKENITTGHGALGGAYTLSWTAEGDTPSFMSLVNNGLEQDKDYTLGGWGGRPEYVKGNLMYDGADVDNGKEDYHYTFGRWLPAAQNDWASRADWCVAATYAEANHQPVVVVTGGSNRKVKPGETITLDASQSTDPDGNTLSFNWWQYHEADNATAKLTIKNNTSKDDASFVVPNELGKELHILCEVKDDGTPPLTRYERVVFTITDEVVGNQHIVTTHSSVKPFKASITANGMLNIANVALSAHNSYGKIVNLSGASVMQFSLFKSADTRQVDVKQLPSGTYLLLLRDNLITHSSVLIKN